MTRCIILTAICIIQDDENDWAQSAATMGSIYENAFITVAATQSADSEDGLFAQTEGLSRGRALESTCLQVCKQSVDDFPLTDWALLWNNGQWPLLHRAWVLQERQLSS